MVIDFDEIRARLEGIAWGTGLTRDAIRLRWPAFPQEVYMHLPSEKEFLSTEELLAFTSARLRDAQVEDIPTEGALADGGPRAWGESPSGAVLAEPEPEGGVASGADSGVTAGDAVSTGGGREGAAYGDGGEEHG